MQSSFFSDLLSAVKKEDLKGLEDFIKSPFFNKNKRVISAFNFVKEKLENGNYDISKEELGFAVFGTERFNDANFRVFLSDFTDLLQRFLVYSQNNPYEELDLISALRKKNLEKAFRRQVKSSDKKFSERKVKDTFDYYALYALKTEQLLPGGEKDYIEPIDEYVDLIYLSMKLDTAIRFQLKGKRWKDNSGLIKQGYIKMDINRKEHPFIYTKLLALELVSGEKDNSKELEKLLEVYGGDVNYLKYTSDILLWYYRKAGQYRKEFELLVKLEGKGIFEPMPPKNLIAIIDAGLNSDNLPGVIKIYNKYSGTLKDKNAVSLVKARMEIYKHNYDSALKEISNISITESYYYEQVSIMKLYIYKAIKDKDAFRYTQDAYRKWKKRKL